MQLFRVSKTESYFLSWGKGERRGKVLCFSVVFTPLFPSSLQAASFSQFWLSKPNVLLASKKLLGPESLVTVRAALAHHLTQAPAGREPMGRPAFLASPGLLEGVDAGFAEQAGSVLPNLQTAALFLPLPRKHVLLRWDRERASYNISAGTGRPLQVFLPASFTGVQYQRAGTRTTQEQGRESCLHGCPTGRPLASGPPSNLLTG